MNLFTFLIVSFIIERLAYYATPSRETHFRTRSQMNNVEYCSFGAVFRQQKFSLTRSWCLGATPGFAYMKTKIDLILGNFSLLL
jgi:hypothetical protein